MRRNLHPLVLLCHPVVYERTKNNQLIALKQLGKGYWQGSTTTEDMHSEC